MASIAHWEFDQMGRACRSAHASLDEIKAMSWAMKGWVCDRSITKGDLLEARQACKRIFALEGWELEE